MSGIRLQGDESNQHFLGKICPSSWVSWSCYGYGMMLALTPANAANIATGGAGAVILGSAILIFFISASLIQRYMRLSLLSSSYGKPKSLTTTGVFGVTRNPIYCAFLIPLASIAYYNAWAAIAATIAYIMGMTLFIIRREEDCLRQTFGALYDEYAARTPRWLVV